MTSSNMNKYEFASSQELAEALSQRIATDLQAAINANGSASLLVSGGSTPKLLFRVLCEKDIDWSKVRIGLVDERWVDPAHEDSNERLIRNELLQGRAAAAEFVGMYQEGSSAEEAEVFCSEKIEKELSPFTVVVLGMGGDAHTASLFPDNPKLEEAYRLSNPLYCIAIHPQSAPHTRMSLTLPAILSAEHLYLHIEGEEKQKVLEEALRGEDRFAMPIRAVLQQNQKTVEVYQV